MPRLLILCDNYPGDMSSGLHLRIMNLCEQLALQNDCYLICSRAPGEKSAVTAEGPFVETYFLEQRKTDRKSIARHFRFSNARFIEKSFPEYFRMISNKLRELAASWNTQAVVSFAPSLAELGLTVDLPGIIDIPDCSSLTIQRALINRSRSLSLAARLEMRLQRHRQIGRERRMLRGYSATTTISQPDKSALLASAGVASQRVSVIPNGVGNEFFKSRASQAKEPRSLVFWGNLDFPPNWTAVRYFYKEVFLPYLAAADVRWYVVGRGANPELEKIGEHPNVHLAGFQEDLVEYVGHKFLTINPMTEGSGLKNKVLESFAMGLPVVTTSLGVEAIGGEDGTHYLVADEPEKFAACVLDLMNDSKMSDQISSNARKFARNHFGWPAIGRDFHTIAESVISAKNLAADT